MERSRFQIAERYVLGVLMMVPFGDGERHEISRVQFSGRGAFGVAGETTRGRGWIWGPLDRSLISERDFSIFFRVSDCFSTEDLRRPISVCRELSWSESFLLSPPLELPKIITMRAIRMSVPHPREALLSGFVMSVEGWIDAIRMIY